MTLQINNHKYLVSERLNGSLNIPQVAIGGKKHFTAFIRHNLELGGL